MWEYNGPDDEAPPERILIEEPLGPYERKLILLTKGELSSVTQGNPSNGEMVEERN